MLEALAPYYDAAQQEAQAREASLPLRELEWMIAELPEQRTRFTDRLATSDDVAVIAEHKRRSPSEGDIRPDSSVARTVQQYQQGGALALSIVTLGFLFGGGIEDLAEARQVSDLPILRKDFIRTPYQLYEARARGADAALLIVAGLSDAELLDLHEEADAIGLDCLVEVHDETELLRALEIGPGLVGINNRNLDTLQVDLDTTRRLIEAVPDTATVVAESGYSVKDRTQISELRAMGADAVLMGTALMREKDPAEALAGWIRP